MKGSNPELNNAEILILEDITTHPGTSISNIIQRVARSYRMHHVKICVYRLKALGYVENRGDVKNKAMLYVKGKSNE